MKKRVRLYCLSVDAMGRTVAIFLVLNSRNRIISKIIALVKSDTAKRLLNRVPNRRYYGGKVPVSDFWQAGRRERGYSPDNVIYS